MIGFNYLNNNIKKSIMNGVFLDTQSLDIGDLDFKALKKTLPEWQFYDVTNPAQTKERIKNAEVIVSNKVVLDKDTIKSAKKLKLICVAATGTNNVDLVAAKKQNITVCNVTAYATPSVVQHVFALILALATKLPDYQRAVRENRWQYSKQFCLLDYPIDEIAGKTMGIIGYGELGQAVAKAAEAFGLNVLIAKRPGSKANKKNRIPLNKLLPQIDILTIHTPLADNTKNLIGKKELTLMKDTALLINTARGGIVDEKALAKALREGKLGGAGVDTLTQEPPTDQNPLLAPDIPNLIVTPHTAWASRASRQRLLDQIVENIEAFKNGGSRNVVV